MLNKKMESMYEKTTMDIQVGDILLLKKEHPCGGSEWQTLRIGVDIRLRCLRCGHEIMAPRGKIVKSVKSVKGRDIL